MRRDEYCQNASLMDALLTAAAHALATGDAFTALKHVALRDDAPALAMRGIALAQMGDLVLAKTLLRRAARAFGPREAVARARCVVAEAEVALATRDLQWSAKALSSARAVLEAHRDIVNARHAQLLEIRRLSLIGRLAEAERELKRLDPSSLPATLRAIHALALAGIALRRLQASAAHEALAAATEAAVASGIAALQAEVAKTHEFLSTPIAQLHSKNSKTDSRPLLLDDIESLFASPVLVIDACRHLVHAVNTTVSLASRPILFALLRALAEAWPGEITRETLIAQVFRLRRPDATHRARLRVELGRLRRTLRGLAEIHATARGYRLQACAEREVVLLLRPVEEPHAAILALLADGEAWSSSALALALGASQRSVQRALEVLHAGGKVEASGEGRSRRWLAAPVPGFTPSLLLLAPLPG